MITQPLLSIRGASKTYAGSPALIDAALDLMPGEVHGLMGENGAGKSTLIKILAGIVTPDSAQIIVRGHPVSINNPADSFTAGLRFIHQELAVVPGLTVAENIFLGRPTPRRMGLLVDWRRLNTKARAALEALGITHIDPRVGITQLSIGDQMLVKIAAAFLDADESTANAARIIVMDEPTAALTDDESARLFRVVRALRDRGGAVLYVSHRMDEIFDLCDRVTVMRDGQVISSLPIQETHAADLIARMTGRQIDALYPAKDSPIDDSQIILRAEHLTTQCIADVTFDLRAGEIIGVAGLMGAGKSELLRALVGADRILSGTMVLGRQRIHRGSLVRSWRAGIAYIPEERRTQGLILSRSVRDNITLPHLGTMSRGGVFLDRGREHRTAEKLGAVVRLKARGSTQMIRELSGGNQQKALFARALATEREDQKGKGLRVMLLDEPTRGVDVGAKADIYLLLRELASRGIGIVMASSDLGELIGVCDRIIVVRAGHQVEILDSTHLTQEQLLTACYSAGKDESA
jgi:ABC-type sugar transport system ATPase subunit